MADLHENYGNTKTAEALDKEVKELGFKFATKSGITIAISDASIPEEKVGILKNAEEEGQKIEQHYKRGPITENGKVPEGCRYLEQG